MTKDQNYDELLAKAKWETLEPEEIAHVARELASSTGAQRQYTMIHILGRALATQHKALIERFLRCPEQPMLSRIALKTLYSYWELTEEYLDVISEFLAGVDWDVDNDVKLQAISIAGIYLARNCNADICGLLLDIFNDRGQGTVVRQAANASLLLAAGREIRSVQAREKHVDLDADIEKGFDYPA